MVPRNALTRDPQPVRDLPELAPTLGANIPTNHRRAISTSSCGSWGDVFFMRIHETSGSPLVDDHHFYNQLAKQQKTTTNVVVF